MIEILVWIILAPVIGFVLVLALTGLVIGFMVVFGVPLAIVTRWFRG